MKRLYLLSQRVYDPKAKRKSIAQYGVSFPFSFHVIWKQRSAPPLDEEPFTAWVAGKIKLYRRGTVNHFYLYRTQTKGESRGYKGILEFSLTQNRITVLDPHLEHRAIPGKPHSMQPWWQRRQTQRMWRKPRRITMPTT